MGINDKVLAAAGALRPEGVRTLDAIHLATAERLAADLRALVTYGERMASAARDLGQRVTSPR